MVWTGHPSFGTKGSNPFGRDGNEEEPSIIDEDEVCVHATRISNVEI
jgi:hypothetical protein